MNRLPYPPRALRSPARDWRLWVAGDEPARILLVFAHPDDEAIGAAGMLTAWDAVEFLCVTDGSPGDLRDARRVGCSSRAEYAQRRAEELGAAVAAAGHPRAAITRMAVPDQEATWRMRDVARVVARKLAAFQPDCVITHPYEGGHPDHDATACAVHLACEWWRAGGRAVPVRIEMTSYHGRDGRMQFGEFLPGDGGAVLTLRLDAEARARRQRVLACHATQAPVLAPVPLDVDRFRLAPEYDFSRPPHDGKLLYEQFPWGMDGVTWRRLALAVRGRRAAAGWPAAFASFR